MRIKYWRTIWSKYVVKLSKVVLGMMEISNRKMELVEKEKEARFQLLERHCEWLHTKTDKKLEILEVELLVLKFQVNGDALKVNEYDVKHKLGEERTKEQMREAKDVEALGEVESNNLEEKLVVVAELRPSRAF